MDDRTIKQTEGWHGALALRISVTDQCRSRCLYCTPAGGAIRFAAQDLLGDQEIVRFVRVMKESFGLTKVRLTGGEPLDRPGIVPLAGLLANEGVGDLALTTNGRRLDEFAAPLKQAGLRRVNVSLNSLNPATFRAIAGGGELAESLRGIDSALRAGLAPLKINMTVLRGMNDHEIADIARFGIALGAVVRFIELMPIGPAAGRHRELFMSSDEVLRRLRNRFDLQPLPYCLGSSSRDYRVAGVVGKMPSSHAGTIGLISPCTQPFCLGCNRLRLKANGDMVGCLATGGGRNILPLLRTGGPAGEEQIRRGVLEVMGQKRAREGFTSRCNMVTMGG